VPSLAGVQAPLAHDVPQAPQLPGSVPRFLQKVAFGPVPQQTDAEVAPAPHLRRRQVGSAQSIDPLLLSSAPFEQSASQAALQLESSQSMFPSQSLSTPSEQLASVAGTGNTPLQAQLTPEQRSRLLEPEQILPVQSGSTQSNLVSASLSSPSLHAVSGGRHAPATQFDPVAQIGFVPHLQLPAVQLSARVGLQVLQVVAGGPQALVVVPGAQVFPLQQPVVQLVESHTQVLVPEQRWPAAQVAAVPQRQLPVAEQLSAVIPHVVQALPLSPQEARVAGLTQLPALQQPLGQLVGSQMQFPPLQWLPAGHIAFEPHRQTPLELHESARTGSQALQAAPLIPHCEAVSALTQVEPLQQPLAQEAALQPAQTWAVQVWAPHEAQAAPFFPHSVFSVPPLQTLPRQHPLAQLVASQTQTPAAQRCPVAQAGPVPQAQAPLVHRSVFARSHATQLAPAGPQLVVPWLAEPTQVAPLQQPPGQEAAVQTHAPPEQVWPAPQAAEVPHLHTPALQVLVLPEQGPHAAPAVPQVDAPCPVVGMHSPALQQPVGQLVASQTQAAPEQRWPAAHALPAPHLQAPVVHRSAVTPHPLHAPPLTPHWVAVVGLMQALPLQQPPAQLAAVQTQLPATHARPAAHALFVPHLQAPPVQRLAEVALQVVHAAPPVPQLAVELVWQTPF